MPSREEEKPPPRGSLPERTLPPKKKKKKNKCFCTTTLCARFSKRARAQFGKAPLARQPRGMRFPNRHTHDAVLYPGMISIRVSQKATVAAVTSAPVRVRTAHFGPVSKSTRAQGMAGYTQPDTAVCTRARGEEKKEAAPGGPPEHTLSARTHRQTPWKPAGRFYYSHRNKASDARPKSKTVLRCEQSFYFLDCHSTELLHRIVLSLTSSNLGASSVALKRVLSLFRCSRGALLLAPLVSTQCALHPPLFFFSFRDGFCLNSAHLRREAAHSRRDETRLRGERAPLQRRPIMCHFPT